MVDPEPRLSVPFSSLTAGNISSMKTLSALPLAFALALLACTALATTETSADLDATNLAAALGKLGPDTDFTAFFVPDVDIKGIIAADKVTLTLVPPETPSVGVSSVRVSSVRELTPTTTNQGAKAIFSWLATSSHIVWKLSLFDIEGFTGAHLHLNTPAGPIVQHLVPSRPDGDFISPLNIPISKVYVGSFGTSELKSTLGVTSIREFITDFISQNEIYINVHGPGNAPILRGFLNA
jgi:hypothetical protein